MMDGPIPPFGLAPFEFGSEFPVPSHLRHNADNFKAPGSREFRLPPPLSSIFSREFLPKPPTVEDTRHMAGNLEIADLQEDELPGMMPAMNDGYINSTSSSLGCTPPQQSGLHSSLTGLHPPNFLQDSGVSDDVAYSRDAHRDSFAQFAASSEYGLKSEAMSDSRFHLNAPPGISTIAALQAPKMRSIYGPNLNPTFTDAPTPPSMYNYFQTQPNDTHKTSQFYARPFQGFPFDSSDGVNASNGTDHGFQEKDNRSFVSSLGGAPRSSTEPRQKHAPTSHGDSHDVEDVEDTNRCKNTVEGTKTSVRRFKKWYKDKFGKSVDMNAVTRQMAVELLKDFFLEIRDTRPGKEGNEYEPVTLTTYRNGLRRYFLERKVPPALENFDLADREFDVVNYGLVTKRNELKRKGKGNHPNVVESITEEQLERMWASGAIGVHAPRPLLRLQWWINTVSHGIRGRMAHHDLSIDDFRISRGPDGKIIIDHAKAGSKRPRADDEKETSRSKKKCKARVVATDGGERDPVRAFEVYLRHRPPGISSFYLTPKHKPKGDIWFNKVPMGKNSIGRIMREIKAIAGIG